jgi:hypothetical protein
MSCHLVAVVLILIQTKQIRITVFSKVQFLKNEHARYTVEYFLVDNARIIYTKGPNS